jgi:hypothetical protein
MNIDIRFLSQITKFVDLIIETLFIFIDIFFLFFLGYIS